jgi:opacity protein-like surface antigen
MKHTNQLWICAVIAMGLAAVAFAADVTGTWTASFDTQVGKQDYTYTFKQTGTKLTGKAKSDFAMATTEITEGTVNGDDVSFVENLDYMGMPLRIVYKGKIAGDEIKFTRTVIEGMPEEAVAKKSK